MRIAKYPKKKRPQEKYKQVTITVKPETKEKILKLAELEQRNVSNMVARLLFEAVQVKKKLQKREREKSQKKD